MATPQWIQNIGATLRDTVLPVALGVVGGGALTSLFAKPAASGTTGAVAQQALQPTVQPQTSAVTQTAQAGIMTANVAGIPIILIAGAVVLYLVFRK